MIEEHQVPEVLDHQKLVLLELLLPSCRRQLKQRRNRDSIESSGIRDRVGIFLGVREGCQPCEHREGRETHGG
jgi:hypothetical protein